MSRGSLKDKDSLLTGNERLLRLLQPEQQSNRFTVPWKRGLLEVRLTLLKA